LRRRLRAKAVESSRKRANPHNLRGGLCSRQ
jgi:hypothetical protein